MWGAGKGKFVLDIVHLTGSFTTQMMLCILFVYSTIAMDGNAEPRPACYILADWNATAQYCFESNSSTIYQARLRVNRTRL